MQTEPACMPKRTRLCLPWTANATRSKAPWTTGSFLVPTNYKQRLQVGTASFVAQASNQESPEMTHRAVHSRNPGKVNPSSSWTLRKWQPEFCFKATQLQSFFNKLYWLCACVYICAFVCARTHTKMSKDNLWKMASSFYHVGSGDGTQTVRLGGGRQPSVICLRSLLPLKTVMVPMCLSPMRRV